MLKLDHITVIADLGARLRAFTLEHPDPAAVEALYRALTVDRPPAVRRGGPPPLGQAEIAGPPRARGGRQLDPPLDAQLARGVRHPMDLLGRQGRGARGSEAVDRHLYDGEYYFQIVEPPKAPVAPLSALSEEYKSAHPRFQIGNGCLITDPAPRAIGGDNGGGGGGSGGGGAGGWH